MISRCKFVAVAMMIHTNFSDEHSDFDFILYHPRLVYIILKIALSYFVPTSHFIHTFPCFIATPLADLPKITRLSHLIRA